MITREYLESRIQQLVAARDKLQADVNGNNGAIQLCRQLLAELGPEPEGAVVTDDDPVHDELVNPMKTNGADPDNTAETPFEPPASQEADA